MAKIFLQTISTARGPHPATARSGQWIDYLRASRPGDKNVWKQGSTSFRKI
jgi:hypothetical protein